VPYGENKCIFVDLFTGIIKAVDIERYYQKQGSYWVVRNTSFTAQPCKRSEIPLSWFASFPTEELLGLFYRDIHIMPVQGLQAIMYKKIGYAYDELGNPELSRYYYKKALTIDPEYVTPCLGLAFQSLIDAHYSEALREFEAAIALNPREASAYMGSGVAHSALGNVPESIENYAQGVALSNAMISYIEHLDDQTKQMIMQRAQQLRAESDYDGGRMADGSWLMAYGAGVPFVIARRAKPDEAIQLVDGTLDCFAPSGLAMTNDAATFIAIAKTLRLSAMSHNDGGGVSVLSFGCEVSSRGVVALRTESNRAIKGRAGARPHKAVS
jgi:tetratricopeptide (TPR) repeat protein